MSWRSCPHALQVAGKLMMTQLAHLVGKNLSMGIDAETASVSELTPRQLVLAATSALNRGIEVRCALLSFKKRSLSMRV